MKKILFYLHLHQPKRLKKFSVFDIGKNGSYFDYDKNYNILKRVVEESYRPTFSIFLNARKFYKDKFNFALSVPGVALEQLAEFFPDILEKIKDLVWSKNLELIGETYYHSLSYVVNLEEFFYEVRLQKRLFKKLFNFKPLIFRNTEFIYNNDLAEIIFNLGYKGIFAEGTEKVLGRNSSNYLYYASNKKVVIFPKNYKLSDDIAFRFSEKSWDNWPLDAEKFLYWIEASDGDIINLMMDFETFGEHHKKETGIFEFLENFIEGVIKREWEFILPSKALKIIKPIGVYDAKEIITWADTERDLSAWLGNDLQKSAISELNKIYRLISKKKNKELLNLLRYLQTSDHFYYMCTKWFQDGDVHKYFNPYQSPYEAYLSFMYILEDIKYKLLDRRTPDLRLSDSRRPTHNF